MSCCLFYCHRASQLDQKPFKRVIAFCFSSTKSEGYTLDSRLTPTRSKKNSNEIPPATSIPPQNHTTGLSTPFQLNSKPNSSPQRTLQSSNSKKASHPNSVIMLLGPAMATVNQIDPDQAKGVHSSQQARYFAPRSPRK